MSHVGREGGNNLHFLEICTSSINFSFSYSIIYSGYSPVLMPGTGNTSSLTSSYPVNNSSFPGTTSSMTSSYPHSFQTNQQQRYLFISWVRKLVLCIWWLGLNEQIFVKIESLELESKKIPNLKTFLKIFVLQNIHPQIWYNKFNKYAFKD